MNTRERVAGDIERYQRQRDALGNVVRFKYQTGSDYANGILATMTSSRSDQI